MTSNLYKRSLSVLSPKKRRLLIAFKNWLKSVRIHPNEWPIHGVRLVKNLCNEAHFTGTFTFGTPNAFAEFLGSCATRHAECLSDLDRFKCYSVNCNAHAGKGLPVPRPHLPHSLLKYSTNRTLASQLVLKLLGEEAQEQFDLGVFTPEDAFAEVKLSWDSSRIPDHITLGQQTYVWTTFEHAGTAPRDDAKAMAESLALPSSLRPPSGSFLFELSFPTDSVVDYRFPTVADAEWVYLFQPAPEIAPDLSLFATQVGWTKPIGEHPPKPEIVHLNAPVKVVQFPPRFIGRIL